MQKDALTFPISESELKKSNPKTLLMYSIWML